MCILEQGLLEEKIILQIKDGARRASNTHSVSCKASNTSDDYSCSVPSVLMVTDFCNGHMGPDDPVLQAEMCARNVACMLVAVGEE